MEENKKKCVVGYASVFMKGSGFVHGRRPDYDRTEPCCDAFNHAYGQNRFLEKPNDVFQSRPGLKLLVRGGELRLTLNLDGYGDTMKFCPYCGSEIEVRQTSKVVLTPKTAVVPDGYTEEIVSSK